jgi:LPXTG-motif cell wall-anchored protein
LRDWGPSSAPLFAVSFLLLLLSEERFSVVWRYFAWSNQTLAMVTLWALTVYLARARKNDRIALIPALFMTAVSAAYILIAQEGFALSHGLSYGIAGGVTAALSAGFFLWKRKKRNSINRTTKE